MCCLKAEGANFSSSSLQRCWPGQTCRDHLCDTQGAHDGTSQSRCGIVAGDVIRRLVARTISQQLSQAVEAATAPFQYALSTSAGCECIAHTLQGLIELNPLATVVSIDGISVCDQISRDALRTSRSDVPRLNLFLLMGRFVWCFSHNQAGRRRRTGRCADALVVRFGQHRALVAIESELQDGEFLFG